MNRFDKIDNELEGTLERIVFCSEETGFLVGRIRSKLQHNLITIAGFLSGTNIGEYLLLKGTWEIHPEYGQQFKVNSYQSEQPVTAEGIEKFLSNSLIKGIGPKTSHKIVNHWGKDSLNIIENEPNRLCEIDGIGKHKSELISRGWQEKKSIKNLMLFLHKNGITATVAHKLYRHYGDKAYQVINSNPYKLAQDIYGIGFNTADKIAVKLGLDYNSPQRLEAAIIHLLQEASEDGHCYLSLQNIINGCCILISCEDENERQNEFSSIKNQILNMVKKERIIVTYPNINATKLSLNISLNSLPDGALVYLPSLYFSERNTAKRLIELYYFPTKALDCFGMVDWYKAFEWLVSINNSSHSSALSKSISYSNEQKNAIVKSLTNKISIITGGPGTGKSTITAALVKLCEIKNKKVVLAAPTGRAAKKLSEVTATKAQTIHRLLEFSWQNGLHFKRNNDNPINADLIIIDEVSMLDILLLNNLIKAVRMDSHLVFLGDIDQLPSVGAGNVLKDMINSEILPVYRLIEVFRQSANSYITINACRIRSGIMPTFPQYSSKSTSSNSSDKSDFFFFGAESAEKASHITIDLVSRKIPDQFGFSPVNDIQVLAPMHKGIVGISELNRLLQNKLNPAGKEVILGPRTFRVNDRIIQLRNNYEKEVFNGDFGSIIEINKESQTVIIEFEDVNNCQNNLNVCYDFSELDQITHSYAITIHKSQGCEFPVVVIPFTTQHFIMLERNLFYTAVTRAKKLVVIVGTLSAIEIALKNVKSYARNTTLAKLLGELSHQINSS